ncbi:MAG: MFS transporter [Hyphomicrobiales bacterium]|nr:MFS transporter [Hyphomicrobiales bacterium]
MVNASATYTVAGTPVSHTEQRRVIVASSVGTVFEWYDFYLYATLAPFFAALFFPSGNATAGLLAAFATYAAGFVVRPLGALVFGRVGDIVGRKYTFLVTIVIMGFATFAVGLLPTFDDIGWVAPVLLVVLRLLQGLALGGEYGGAATYVAEYAPNHRRGYATAWIQTTATAGFLMALIVIGFCRYYFDDATFRAYGWRIPFLVSIVLLFISIYIRIKLRETPVFRRMKAEGRGSERPLADSFFKWPNNGTVALALFGATAGQGVVWYTGQFYALFFLTLYLKLDYLTAYFMIGISLLVAIPFFILFGWLSDRIGRLKIILAGCLLAALTYMPLFHQLAKAVNPELTTFQERYPVTLYADPATCNVLFLPKDVATYSECDVARDFLTKAGLSFSVQPIPPGQPIGIGVGVIRLEGWSEARWMQALQVAGYPAKLNYDKIDYVTAELILIVMLIYVTMVYGPIAAFLVELFPTRIRYTSMSLPYHLGNGWMGGMLPLVATAMVGAYGNIYAGLWYPIAVAALTFVIGALFLRDQTTRPIHH